MFTDQALAYLILLVAAVLEAGGDAFVRLGLHQDHVGARVGLFVAGAATLFAYGLVVNAPAWDFGKLLGVYVSLFFVVAQLVNFVVFSARPDGATLAGGALIVVGGLVVAFVRIG
jgi:small multidrug resistance family-3 protein